MRRSASDPATSCGVPLSLSSNSGTTTRFMRSHLFQLFFEKLLVVQLGVIPVASQEFIVRSQFDDPALMQHRDAIGVAHCGNAMGDENRGAALHDLAQMVEDFFFSVG